MKLRTLLLPAFAVVAVSANAADFFTDFSTTTNTTLDLNPWVYGISGLTPGGAITPFADYTPVGGDGLARWSTLPDTLLVPAAFKNTTGTNGVHGLDSGAAALHGGPNGEIAVAAYTFPTTSLYHIFGSFGAGHFGDVDEYISINGLVLAPYTHLSDATGFSFDFYALGTAGQNVAFSVGTAGSFSGDTTPLNATIQAVPEPASMAALGLGALGLLKRRRKA